MSGTRTGSTRIDVDPEMRVAFHLTRFPGHVSASRRVPSRSSSRRDRLRAARRLRTMRDNSHRLVRTTRRARTRAPEICVVGVVNAER
jgi:hypothetical protein